MRLHRAVPPTKFDILSFTDQRNRQVVQVTIEELKSIKDIAYLPQENIDIAIADKYCKQIKVFGFNDRDYWGCCFPNIHGVLVN